MSVASTARGTITAGDEQLLIAVVGSLAMGAGIALVRFSRG